MSPYLTTGVPGSWTESNQPPSRRDIIDFAYDDYAFTLYVRALQSMAEMSQDSLLSHFQIGGIHGLPYKRWNESGGASSAGDFGGYCTHGSVLFPTWHRPYVAIYEQLVQSTAVDIATKFTSSQSTWTNAANNLRIPFWDWGYYAPSLPPQVTESTVTIIDYNGSYITVDNPLYAYTFNPIDPSFAWPFCEWPTTMRYPSSCDSSATSDNDCMLDTLYSEWTTITDNIYYTLVLTYSWDEFSNHTSDSGAYNSLETVHDTIHDLVGGGGHMGDPGYAGFDPIFFLHHSNVDRMLAFWQAINPYTWVSQGKDDGRGTYTIQDSSPEDASSDLTPFWKDSNTYWNSNTCRDWMTTYGYQYPEFEGLDLSDTDAVTYAILNWVYWLYYLPFDDDMVDFAVASEASSAKFSGVRDAVSKTAVQAKGRELAKLKTVGPKGPRGSKGLINVAGSANPHPISDSNFNLWTARVRFNKFELGESFSVLIFIGPVPTNPAEWRRSKSYVGSVNAFVNTAMQNCENCQNRAGEITQGAVHLNRVLKRSGVQSFDEGVVIPHLTPLISWRVMKLNRTEVPVEQLTSLQVTVLHVPLTKPAGSPIHRAAGPAVHHHEVTHGRVGGFVNE